MATRSPFFPPSAAAEAAALRAGPLDLAALLAGFGGDAHGAVVTFQGVVRGSEEGRSIRAIIYEAYEGMAEREFSRIAAEAAARWPVEARLLHRVGRVPAGEASLIVAARGGHRAEAFEACRFIVEQVKARAAIWKTEFEWG